MKTRITFGWPGSTQYPRKHKRTKGKKWGLHRVTGFYTWIAVLLETSSSYVSRLRRLTFSFHPRPQTKLQRPFHTLQPALRNWHAVDTKARLRNTTSGNKANLDVAVRTCHNLHRWNAAHSWIQSLLYMAPNKALRCRTGSVIDHYRKAKSSALRGAVPRYKNTLYNRLLLQTQWESVRIQCRRSA